MSATPTRPRRVWTFHFGAGPEWSLRQLALTGAQILAVVLFLVAMGQATGGFDGIIWALATVPLLTMSWAGSAVPLVLWGLLVTIWFYLSPTGAFSWWSLLGATGVALGHAASALSATTPPEGQIAREALLRWARHTGIAYAAAIPVALLVGAVRDRDLAIGPVAFVIGLLGLALGLWLVRSNPPATGE
ncbi:hypothetical protein GCM10027053_42250 [Intrasporangium mesophilum]